MSQDLCTRLQSAEDLRTRTSEEFEMEQKAAANLREELANERNQYLQETAHDKAKYNI